MQKSNILPQVIRETEVLDPVACSYLLTYDQSPDSQKKLGKEGNLTLNNCNRYHVGYGGKEQRNKAVISVLGVKPT